jgi:uncharacterized protein
LTCQLDTVPSISRGTKDKIGGNGFLDNGFIDEEGNFSLRGPDYNGQIRQLRSTDGVYFIKAGTVKLGHYVEREIQRLATARATPVALPAPEPQPVRWCR